MTEINYMHPLKKYRVHLNEASFYDAETTMWTKLAPAFGDCTPSHKDMPDWDWCRAGYRGPCAAQLVATTNVEGEMDVDVLQWDGNYTEATASRIKMPVSCVINIFVAAQEVRDMEPQYDNSELLYDLGISVDGYGYVHTLRDDEWLFWRSVLAKMEDACYNNNGIMDGAKASFELLKAFFTQAEAKAEAMCAMLADETFEK